MRKTVGTTGAVALVVATAVAVFALTDDPDLDDVCYLGVMVGAAIGAWIGAEHAPREARLVPRLIAIGVSLTAVGDVLWTILDRMGADTDVSIADPPWFASYAFLCAALWVVLGRGRRQGARRMDVDSMIDALTIVVVSVLIFWSFSIGSIVADGSATPLERAVWSVYPVADAILFALVVRVLMSRAARTTIDPSFAVGVCLWLATDIAYLNAPESSVALVAMDVAWMVAPVLLARAAWRVRDDATGAATCSGRGGWVAQLTVAVGPLMVPPALELVSDLRGQPDQPVLLLTGTAALVTLAFVRTARLIRSKETALRELEVARDAAVKASDAKSMFLANVSHEIRTPLTTVLATAEILEDTGLSDTQLKLLAKMHRSGELLRKLVEGILDFSRIEAGQVDLASDVFDLHAMVMDVADVYEPRSRQAGIRFAVRLDPGVPQAVVGDPGRLFQVLSNLLDNALKFTHQGQVTMTVRPARTVVASVEFVVSDTGIGIREEELTSVFDSFRQVDGSMTRRYGGSGLGLAICRDLAHLMGGSLTVQSQFGAGTTFVFQMPVGHLPADTSREWQPVRVHRPRP